jgi:UDP-N-acetyl-D-mannosaminuronic acid dehydrogenase
MKLCVLGLGYVGLTMSIHAAKSGFEVHGVEISAKVLDCLHNKKAPFFEPAMDLLLNQVLDKNFFVHRKVPSNIEFDVFLISVGTPLIDTKKELNHASLYKAIESLAENITETSTIMLRSTVAVGTTREVGDYLKDLTGIDNLKLCFCPERTAEGRALAELPLLPQVVSGNTQEALDVAVNFFKPLTKEVVVSESLEEAELVKLFNNMYRDAKFAMANTFNLLAQAFGVDGKSVIEKANRNYERSNIPSPGFVAGPCLEKDAYILASNVSDPKLKDIILTMRKANIYLELRVIEYLKGVLKTEIGSNILISGIAFKGIPETNDLRGSSSINILSQLEEYQQNITIHDFMNTKNDLESQISFNAIEPSDLLSTLNQEISHLVILNNHPSYKSNDLSEPLKLLVDKGLNVIDCWGVLGLDNTYTLGNLFKGH